MREERMSAEEKKDYYWQSGVLQTEVFSTCQLIPVEPETNETGLPK